MASYIGTYKTLVSHHKLILGSTSSPRSNNNKTPWGQQQRQNNTCKDETQARRSRKTTGDNTYCTTTIRNIISAQAIRAQHTDICCFWNNTVYTVTLLWFPYMWGCVVCPLTFTSHVCLVCEGRPCWAGAHDVRVHSDLVFRGWPFWNWQGCHHPFRIQQSGKVPFFFYCYPWSTMDRSARHIFVRSDGISAATPEFFRRWLVALWCPFHSPPLNLRETLSGPFIVLSFSSHRSHAMVWHVKAAWLTRRHVLWAYCTVRMDG